MALIVGVARAAVNSPPRKNEHNPDAVIASGQLCSGLPHTDRYDFWQQADYLTMRQLTHPLVTEGGEP
jgi:hypothetical protein